MPNGDHWDVFSIMLDSYNHIWPVREKYLREIAVIFLSISLNMCFGVHRDGFLSTHNICFG